MNSKLLGVAQAVVGLARGRREALDRSDRSADVVGDREAISARPSITSAARSRGAPHPGGLEVEAVQDEHDEGCGGERRR